MGVSWRLQRERWQAGPPAAVAAGRHRTLSTRGTGWTQIGSIDFGVCNGLTPIRFSGFSTPASRDEAKARLFAPPGDLSLLGYITLQFLDCSADLPDKGAELRLRSECRCGHRALPRFRKSAAGGVEICGRGSYCNWTSISRDAKRRYPYNYFALLRGYCRRFTISVPSRRIRGNETVRML